jgi:vancomycin permeability regulator SanA
MIDLLLMCRRIDMLVQGVKISEALMAQVAFVALSLVIVRCRSHSDGRREVVVRQEFLSDHMVWIATTDLGQQCVAVKRVSIGTGATLEMMRNACGRREGALTERTGDVGTSVDFAIQMLITVRPTARLRSIGK